MKVRIDSEGRVRIPKAIREAVGLVPGSTVEITEYGGA
ncbi:AbrB/MazE/SpoVT family DNA-binding domain-containing protein [Corynebacterium riegelii]|nr:AbrB/MazE/SpoVT family DNA-binding domain-containing protein [Corynebacterium riegelii]